MTLIRAGLQDDVHGRATSAELRLHGTFLDAKFLNGVWRRLHGQRPLPFFVVVHSIQQKIVIEAGQSVYGKLNARTVVVGASTERPVVLASLAAPGAQPRQLYEISSIQPQ